MKDIGLLYSSSPIRCITSSFAARRCCQDSAIPTCSGPQSFPTPLVQLAQKKLFQSHPRFWREGRDETLKYFRYTLDIQIWYTPISWLIWNFHPKVGLNAWDVFFSALGGYVSWIRLEVLLLDGTSKKFWNRDISMSDATVKIYTYWYVHVIYIYI